ncbi:secreted protein, partial [Rhodopirellula maiorica SM1]
MKTLKNTLIRRLAPLALLTLTFLSVPLATLEHSFAASPQPTAPDAMNILVLYADDWRNDTLGVAGNPVVKTPALDQLASQG